jgi:hypothetical protein
MNSRNSLAAIKEFVAQSFFCKTSGKVDSQLKKVQSKLPKIIQKS